jgi:hypothetical protein
MNLREAETILASTHPDSPVAKAILVLLNGERLKSFVVLTQHPNTITDRAREYAAGEGAQADYFYHWLRSKLHQPMDSERDPALPPSG